jgi:Concanavalin A-like lectin/glucanases superfamily/Fibronectin type III domain
MKKNPNLGGWDGFCLNFKHSFNATSITGTRMNTIFLDKLNSYYRNLNRFLLFGFALFLFGGHAFAADITLAWDASASTGVGGYKIYYGQTSNNYTSTPVDAGNSTTGKVTGLTAGSTYYFAVKAYSAANNSIESSFSNEVSKTIPVATPTCTVTQVLVNNVCQTKTCPTGQLLDAQGVCYTPTPTPPPTCTVTQVLVNNVCQPKTCPTGQLLDAQGVCYTPTPTPPPTCTVTQVLVNNVCQTKTCPTGQLLNAQGVCYTPTPTCSVTQVLVNNVCQTKTCPTGQQLDAQGVCYTPTPTNVSGLVAAYGFEEFGGATTADASGNSNHGTINGAVRSATGYSGKALKFDGVNDWVTVNDSASLDLSSHLTLEAWVNPAVLMSSWKTVLMKEQPGDEVYTLYANTDLNKPMMAQWINGSKTVSGSSNLAPNTWWHIAATYDGIYQRLYVNGVQVNSRAQTGLIQQSNGELRIGGNSIFGEYFNGLIDEVKIYNRQLSNADISKDYLIAVSVSNPPQLVVGNKTLEPYVDSNIQGQAEAFKTTPQKKAVLTAIQVYLDARSTATELVAGIYSDIGGHPGVRLTQGKIISPKAGATNTVPINTTTIEAAKPYWIAILGSKGQIKFRIRGAASNPLETSASKVLTSLPSQWTTGTVYPSDGPMSVYGTGY